MNKDWATLKGSVTVAPDNRTAKEVLKDFADKKLKDIEELDLCKWYLSH